MKWWLECSAGESERDLSLNPRQTPQPFNLGAKLQEVSVLPPSPLLHVTFGICTQVCAYIVIYVYQVKHRENRIPRCHFGFWEMLRQCQIWWLRDFCCIPKIIQPPIWDMYDSVHDSGNEA